jgi:holo-[acyl-carrier protein] synthase
MILGIGTDIIEIDRIKKAMERTPSFLKKAFTESEIEFFKSRAFKVETIAGNFAAKEAVSKAIGTGIRDFALSDIEILRDELGKPIVNISDLVKKNIKVDNFKLHLSIAHNKSTATAYVILEAI